MSSACPLTLTPHPADVRVWAARSLRDIAVAIRSSESGTQVPRIAARAADDLYAAVRPGRLGRLRQGILHRDGRHDAFDPRRRGGGRPRGLHALAGGLRQALPNAGLLLDLRPLPRPRDRPRLAHLSGPQGLSLRLLLSAVERDRVRREGAALRGRDR